MFKMLKFKEQQLNLKLKKKNLFYLLQDPNILHYVLINSNPALKLKMDIHGFIVFSPYLHFF